MSLISEALRRAQEFKIEEEKTGVQNGVSGEILLGPEIVVGRPAKKSFLSQNRLIIFGLSSLLLLISIGYSSSIFRKSPALKEETHRQEIRTPDPSAERIGSKPVKLLFQKSARRVHPLKTAPAWQAKKRPDRTHDAKVESGTGIESAERDFPHTGSQSISAPTRPRQEEKSHSIASEPLDVESDRNISTKDYDYNNLGVAYYLSGNLEKALEQFKAAIQLNPKNLESYVNLGIVYKRQNKLQYALKAYKKAISLKPTCPELYYNLAILYDDLGDFKRAAIAYHRFLQSSPEKYHSQKQKAQERLDLIRSYIK